MARRRELDPGPGARHNSIRCNSFDELVSFNAKPVDYTVC